MPCSYCGKPKVVAKGLCNACYYRQKKNGTLEYKPRKASPLHCKLEGCDRPVVARGYCETHYRNALEFGDPVRTFGYGERKAHPLYEPWRYQVRCKQGRVPEWNDFWAFVSDIGERQANCIARRYDKTKPWGPDNFYWSIVAGSSDDAKRYARDWRKRNPIQSKHHSLKKSYGISIEQYMGMYEAQQGKCAICGAQKLSFCTETGRSQTLVVDHCHDKKHVRALLCSACNKGIGLFLDSPDLLEKAKQYLVSHQIK